MKKKEYTLLMRVRINFSPWNKLKKKIASHCIVVENFFFFFRLPLLALTPRQM